MEFPPDPDHPILERAWEYKIIELHWKETIGDPSGAFIDLVLQRGTTIRRLRFLSPAGVQLSEPLYNIELYIREMRGRGWENRIGVWHDDEPLFYAADVIDMDQETTNP